MIISITMIQNKILEKKEIIFIKIIKNLNI